jgi:hypothetical protein
LWKCRFHLHYNASKEEIHDVGGAIVSIRSESQYLKFEMADSKLELEWFYIKDQKAAESDEYGLAPFNPNKSLTKLKSWDTLHFEAKAEEIKPLLTQILDLKKQPKRSSMVLN